MESRFILFINPEDAIAYTNPFENGYRANGVDLGENMPVWSQGKIILVWDPIGVGYGDDIINTIRTHLGELANKGHRIGVALHRNVRLGEDAADILIALQQEMVRTAIGENSVIDFKIYNKGEGVEPYCLFCDALITDDDAKVNQALKRLDAFFFESTTHDMALKLLIEWLPDYLGGTIPGSHDQSNKLWEEFKSQVGQEGQVKNDAGVNSSIFREIERMVEAVENANDPEEFSKQYESLYHKLGSFIER